MNAPPELLFQIIGEAQVTIRLLEAKVALLEGKLKEAEHGNQGSEPEVG